MNRFDFNFTKWFKTKNPGCFHNRDSLFSKESESLEIWD
jgi:hypothetical protein